MRLCSDLVNILLVIAVLGTGCGQIPVVAPRTMYSVQEAQAEPANAASLVLSGRELTAVPPEVASLQALRGLDLSGNKLEKLPDFLARLPNLELLDLRNNQLGELPDLRQLKLKRLDLSENQLTRVANLPPTLEELYLSQNQLTTAQGLAELKSLRLLHLGGNKLTELPDDLGTLVNLEELNVSDNQLTRLPATFSDLDRLQTLIARKNKLTELGFDPARNDRLLLVRLEDNPIPPEAQKELKKAQSRSEWRFSAPLPEEDSQ